MHEAGYLTIAVYKGSRLLSSGELALTAIDGTPQDIDRITCMSLKSNGIGSEINITATISLKARETQNA